MGVTSIDEIKKKTQKEITTRSGDVYLIRKLKPYRYIETFKSLPNLSEIFSAGAEKIKEKTAELLKNDPDKLEKAFGMQLQLLDLCVIEPKINIGMAPPTENSISIDDVPWEDVEDLIKEIWEFSGISKKEAAAANFS